MKQLSQGTSAWDIGNDGKAQYPLIAYRIVANTFHDYRPLDRPRRSLHPLWLDSRKNMLEII